MSEQSTSIWQGRTFKGLVPWVIIFLTLFAIERNLDYRIVYKGRDLAGLADNTLYLYTTTPELCVNQAVYAKLNKRRVLVPIGAVAGQTVSTSVSELSIDGTVIDLGDSWTAVAVTEIADEGIRKIPQGHVLLINTGFKAGHEFRGWGVAVVPETDVGASLSQVLFSRDFNRIGQPAKELGGCIARISVS
ncbi:hypothetical protein [Ruegeria sp.]|uniref:hypothetical protein n=1 Tax=Ruegeria sp. TaxID=1879320 RepID=UPI0023275D76|nr:hypothetical protein [Ruegeria sp.]MDA7967270.1 hypothetical protein [Ruegeria sp.]